MSSNSKYPWAVNINKLNRAIAAVAFDTFTNDAQRDERIKNLYITYGGLVRIVPAAEPVAVPIIEEPKVNEPEEVVAKRRGPGRPPKETVV